MRAGRLRHFITIEQRTTTQSTYGEPADTWTPIYVDERASIDPLSARELLTAMTIASDVTHRIVMRYKAGIQTKHRVKFGTRIFDIRGVRNIEERNRELELFCTEGMSLG